MFYLQNFLHFVINYAVSSFGTQAALGALFGISVIVNIMLVIAVLVLLIKPRAKHTAKELSDEKENEEVDIEMKPNKLYGLTGDTIVTKPNKVYDISFRSPMEQSQPETYCKYLDP